MTWKYELHLIVSGHDRNVEEFGGYSTEGEAMSAGKMNSIYPGMADSRTNKDNFTHLSDTGPDGVSRDGYFLADRIDAWYVTTEEE